MSTDSSSKSTGTKVEIREFIIDDLSDSEVSSVASSSSEEELEYDRPSFTIPPEYWHIQKLIKYLKTGNPTATVVALCCLKDHDLTEEVQQYAIQDVGGLEVLVNLLDTKVLLCKLGALQILIELATNDTMRQCIVDLGTMPLCVKNLFDPVGDLLIHVGELMHHLGKVQKARKDARHCNGIQVLVDMLNVKEEVLHTPIENLETVQLTSLNMAKSAARALWSLSISRKNMHIMMRSGCVPLLSKLLGSIHHDVVVPIVGTLSQCVVLPSFQMAVCTEEMVEDIVKNLMLEGNPALRRYCCECIFYSSEDPITRTMFREAGGLTPLVEILLDPTTKNDKDLLAAATGAIWKTAISVENAERYEQLNAIDILVKLLENPNEDERVLSNVVGALHEFLKYPHNREVLRRSGGIPYIVNLLNYTYQPLLENLPMVLRECAEDDDSMRIIEEVDGVRLIWSLLKNSSTKVQANAAWCLVPCIRNALDSGELVRSFVGGLEIIVHLLKSEHNNVLACVCAAIAEVARDLENLAVITDHGVIPRLVDLVATEDPLLREHLCSAIAYCSAWGSNCKMFGRLGAITPLVGYMADDHPNVHRTAAVALFHLSENPFNCITMHESGVVIFLLKCVGSDDPGLQEAAAKCVANIRKLALLAETHHLIRKTGSSSSEDEY